MKIYEVGGSIRDRMMGLECKDHDFAVEASSFEEMKNNLTDMGFHIFLENPQFFTIRAKFPRGHQYSGVADFVLCRKEGAYTDGRRPDEVTAGTIFDDLARRDFTMNAMAMFEGELIDPYGGCRDLAANRLRTVGDPLERFSEDYLRALRAIRFTITKNMSFSGGLISALTNPRIPAGLNMVSVERIREEMHKCFAHDTLKTIKMLNNFHEIRDVVFSRGLWLEPTLKR